jgi:hypothetical protein
MRIFFLLFFYVVSIHLFAQLPDSVLFKFKQVEQELKVAQKSFLSRKESERIEGNKKFMAIWEKVIQDPNCLHYPFDSVVEVSKLMPKNKKFKLITWNLPLDNGNHAFFGYLLVDNSKVIKKGLFKKEVIQEYEFFRLLDRSSSVNNPETYIGSTEKWFGMLYTSLIECDDYYTLIGWDGNDKLVQRKFIDVLYFKTDGTPVFGKDVFKIPRKSPRRLMFQYSTEVSMSIKYNEKLNKIVYSHLAPKSIGEVLEGQYQYYGPDGSFDALDYKKGRWVPVEDVDARNDKNKNDKAEAPDPDEAKPIYKPK